MKFKKAYRVIPHWAPDSEYSKGKSEPIYAETASKAKYQAYRDMDYDDEEWFKNRVLRWKEKDLFPPKFHSLAKYLSEKELQTMVHTYGADSHNPGFRNYYNGGVGDPILCGLVKKGIMERNSTRDSMLSKGTTYYHLTECGINITMSTREILRENL